MPFHQFGCFHLRSWEQVFLGSCPHQRLWFWPSDDGRQHIVQEHVRDAPPDERFGYIRLSFVFFKGRLQFSVEGFLDSVEVFKISLGSWDQNIYSLNFIVVLLRDEASLDDGGHLLVDFEINQILFILDPVPKGGSAFGINPLSFVVSEAHNVIVD